MSEPAHRKPIRADLEATPRCTSRYGGYRCKLAPGHKGAHAGGATEGGGRVVWGARRRKR